MAERKDHTKQLRELLDKFENLAEPTNMDDMNSYNEWVRDWQRANKNLAMHVGLERRGIIVT